MWKHHAALEVSRLPVGPRTAHVWYRVDVHLAGLQEQGVKVTQQATPPNSEASVADFSESNREGQIRRVKCRAATLALGLHPAQHSLPSFAYRDRWSYGQCHLPD